VIGCDVMLGSVIQSASAHATSALSPYVVGALTSAIIIGIGWFVVSTQRVTEELTKERRAAYIALLQQADELHGRFGGAEPFEEKAKKDRDENVTELKRRSSAAEFLSSNVMRDSKRQRLLVDAAMRGDTDQFAYARSEFLEVGRIDSHWNSHRRRVLAWHRRRLLGRWRLKDAAREFVASVWQRPNFAAFRKRWQRS
jgi:hypothetical protein